MAPLPPAHNAPVFMNYLLTEFPLPVFANRLGIEVWTKANDAIALQDMPLLKLAADNAECG